jgi:hypothetical protein
MSCGDCGRSESRARDGFHAPKKFKRKSGFPGTNYKRRCSHHHPSRKKSSHLKTFLRTLVLRRVKFGDQNRQWENLNSSPGPFS